MKNTDHNHDKYITTQDFNNSAAGVFTARLAQANLVAKTDFDTKLRKFNKRIQIQIQIKQSIFLLTMR